MLLVLFKHTKASMIPKKFFLHRLASCLNYAIIFQCNINYQKKNKIRKRDEKSPKHLPSVKDRTFEYLSENYLIKLGQLDK